MSVGKTISASGDNLGPKSAVRLVAAAVTPRTDCRIEGSTSMMDNEHEH